MIKVAYILKKFPRLSETFILNELLALEQQGLHIDIFSLRQPDDEPHHPALEQLRASITIVRPLTTVSIFRHLEHLWKQKDEESHNRLHYFCDRLDPSDPWRFEALTFSLALEPLIRQ